MRKSVAVLPGFVSAIVLAACGGGGGADNTAASSTTAVAAGSSSFAGSWTISFSGPDTGSCDDVAIASNGTVDGNCTANAAGKFYVSGAVDAQGLASFGTVEANFSNAPGSLTLFKRSEVANFTGRFESRSTGSGTWTNAAGIIGTWIATPR